MSNTSVNGQAHDREKELKQAAVRFGRRVKQLRKDAGLTQQELAERLSQWGRSYHQTTVAKLESGARPTSLEELIPLSVALRVSQREFFDDPSPADRAEHKVREAEQELLNLRAELGTTHARYLHLQAELQKAADVYSHRVQALQELDPDAAAERRKVVEDLNSIDDELEDSDRDAERRQHAEELKDLAETWRVDRWPA